MFKPYHLLAVSLLIATSIAAAAQTRNTQPMPSREIRHLDTMISRYRYSFPDSALMLVVKGISITEKTNDVSGHALLLNQLGMIHDNQGNYTDSRQNYTEALNLYKSLGSVKGMATETYRLAIIELRNAHYEKAIALQLRALQMSEHIHDKYGIVEANLGLTDLYFAQHKTAIASRYLAIADSINKKLPFSNLSLAIYNAFGALYGEKGRISEAKTMVLRGIALSKESKYNGLHVTMLNTLAGLFAKEGDTSQAINLQKQALKKSFQIKNYIREMESLFNLAKFYESRSPLKSMNYLSIARGLATDKKAYKQVISTMQKMAEINERTGNTKAALSLQKELYHLSDTVYFQSMSKQIISLQASYELNRSRLEVQRLQYINGQQKSEQKISIALAGCTVIILSIIILFYIKMYKVNRELKDNNQVKDKLFSVIAHDLRSPFVSIIGLIELLGDGDIKAKEQQELFRRLGASSRSTLDTLDSLLRWGQMQIKGILIKPVKISANAAIMKVLNLLAEPAAYKQINIENNLPNDLIILADADHFEFIIRNLLSNAIKFTPVGGKINITGNLDIENKKVMLVISDNGVGISAERIKNIFKFNNVSTNGTLDEKGTSMGLLMCREFVEANAGQIEVKSKAGMGTSFYLTFPRG